MDGVNLNHTVMQFNATLEILAPKILDYHPALVSGRKSLAGMLVGHGVYCAQMNAELRHERIQPAPVLGFLEIHKNELSSTANSY